MKREKPNNDGLLGGCAVAKEGTGKKTHVRTERAKSDDLPYTGPVVELPDQGPDGLDEHGAPQAPQDQGPPGASASVPLPTNGGEPGLSSRRIQALADWYSDQAYYQYSVIAFCWGEADRGQAKQVRRARQPDRVGRRHEDDRDY